MVRMTSSADFLGNLGCGIDRNAAAVVADGDAAVGVQLELDAAGMPGHRLVHGVVEHLGDEVMQGALVGAADIHAGAAPHRLQPFQDLDVLGGIAAARPLRARLSNRSAHRLRALWRIFGSIRACDLCGPRCARMRLLTTGSPPRKWSNLAGSQHPAGTGARGDSIERGRETDTTAAARARAARHRHAGRRQSERRHLRRLAVVADGSGRRRHGGAARQGRVATVAITGMTFHCPVFIGDEVSCYAEIVKVGRTSITITIESWARRRQRRRARQGDRGTLHLCRDRRRAQEAPGAAELRSAAGRIAPSLPSAGNLSYFLGTIWPRISPPLLAAVWILT